MTKRHIEFLDHVMSGKKATHYEIDNMHDIMTYLRKKGFRFSSEKSSGNNKVYFCSEEDKKINKEVLNRKEDVYAT